VRQGEELDGWTLDRIQDNVAYFTRGGEMRDLQLAYRPGQTPPGGGALGTGAPRPRPYPHMPSGAMPPDGPPQPLYPYMPPNMNAPHDGMSPYPPGGAPSPSEEAARNAYREALRQGTLPPP
jgi:hypothetical protein